MSGAHSILPPSSAKIWSRCTGWVGMAQKVPDLREDDETALAGEASHQIGEKLIHRGIKNLTDPVEWVGAIADNGVVINEEMVEAAELYAEDALRIFKAAELVGGGISYGIESKVQIPTIHELCFGTTDKWLYAPIPDELIIWDYKFGFLIVEAFENEQALCYLSGLIKLLGLNPQTRVRVRIVQPRAAHSEGPIREWSFLVAQVQGQLSNLAAKAKIAMSSDAKLQTGSHCRYCHARYACPEALKAGMGYYEMAGYPVPVTLSPEALGLQNAIVTRAIEQLTGLKTGYDEQIKALQKTGTVIPGWGLEPAVGRETWSRSVEEVVQLGDLMQKDLRKPGVKTPNQARKLGIDDEVITAYSHRPNNGVKLVQDDGTLARRIFT